MDNFIQYLQANREKLTLVGYLGVILAVALPLADILAEAWETSLEQGGAMNIMVRFLRHGVFGYIISDSHQIVVAAFLGLYFGLLILMTIDPKKRWQSFLLWIGTIVGLLGLQSQGFVLPQFDFSEQAPGLLGGFVVGVAAGGGRKLIELRQTVVLEFRRASQILFVMLASLAVLALVEIHVSYPGFRVPAGEAFDIAAYQPRNEEIAFNQDGLLFNTAIVGVFIVTTQRFIRYDADADFFVLGPRASGKSLFLIGGYLEALNRSRARSTNVPLNPSQDLMSMVSALDRRETEWIVEATGRGQVNFLRFQYIYGSVFPMNVQMSGMDYAGEYLGLLPDAITGLTDEDDMDNTLRRLVDGVENADTLIFVIDVERFVNDEPLDISEYFSIIQASERVDFVLVATKADLLAKEFEEERGLDSHIYYEEFTEYVNTRLRQSENIDALVTETGNRKIHPVYYQTTVNESGDRVPIRDESGSVMTVGFDEFLDKMGRM